MSATLFAADVGGTYVLDSGLDRPNQALASGAPAPNVAAVAAPAQNSAPKPAMENPATPAHAMPSEHRRLAAVVAVSEPSRHVAKSQPVVVAMAQPIDQTVRATKALPKPSIVVHWPAVEQHPSIVVRHQTAVPQRVVHQPIVRHPAVVVAAIAAAPAVVHVAPAAPRVVAPAPRVVALAPVRSEPAAPAFATGQKVASLRDVRRFVMKKLTSKFKGTSVISSSTYADGANVVVDLVVRDKNHVWFEKDYVHRTGTKLAVAAEKQRTMPHVESRGAPLVLTADTQ